MGVRRIWRLLLYMRPYALYSLGSVFLMALVGAMAAFRVLLVKQVFDKVLNPNVPNDAVLVFTTPYLKHPLDLHLLVPGHLHNAWNVMAYALVMSAIVKSISDYVGTYLVNYAGFGMITDLRNDLYNAVLRRSMSFFQKHSTGSLLSTLINDIEKVQTAMSAVLGEFLQQFFTLVFLIGVAIFYGGRLSWVLLLFVPVVISSARRIGRSVRQTTRRGQDKLAEIQNILHETITGNSIVKAFGMEIWEMGPLSPGRTEALPGEPEIGERGGDQFAPDGCAWLGCDRPSAVPGTAGDPSPAHDGWLIHVVHHRGVYAL